jgi:hypothetical protein
LLRDPDVLQEVKVVAFGNFAQRAALAGAGEPSADVERISAMSLRSRAFE